MYISAFTYNPVWVIDSELVVQFCYMVSTKQFTVSHDFMLLSRFIYSPINVSAYLLYMLVVDWTHMLVVDWTHMLVVDWTHMLVVDWTHMSVVDWTHIFQPYIDVSTCTFFSKVFAIRRKKHMNISRSKCIVMQRCKTLILDQT